MSVRTNFFKGKYDLKPIASFLIVLLKCTQTIVLINVENGLIKQSTILQYAHLTNRSRKQALRLYKMLKGSLSASSNKAPTQKV